jgi:hypothetical protein
MPCTRQYPLDWVKTPHCVFLRLSPHGKYKPFTSEELQEHRDWLADEQNGTNGLFLCGGYTDQRSDPRMDGFLYRFTDANTAFHFKMRFG